MSPDDVNLFVSDSSGGEEDVGYFPVVEEPETPLLVAAGAFALCVAVNVLLGMICVLVLMFGTL